MRNKIELVKRYSLFFIGILSNAMGVAFITKSMLGTGPTTCIPYIFSLEYPLSLGMFNFIFNIILLLLQMLFLRRNFKKYQLLQIPVSFLFSVCIDGAMFITSFVQVDFYIVAIIYTVLGCVLRAFGVSCQIIADVVMLSPEAFVKSISDVLKKDFSVCKLVSDAFMAVITIVLSYLWFGELFAVREGTLITVILVGPVSHFFTKRFGYANHYLENEGEFVYETKLKLVEGKRLVVTITSEAGSGGRVIARVLGNILNIPVYDKELVDMVAEQGDFSKSFVKRHNEKLYRNAIQAFFMENYTFVDDNYERYRDLFDAQCEVIRQLAEKEDCIIVGHCSNYVLRELKGAIHLFITADLEQRISYISEKYSINEEKALEKIQKQDSDTYEYYLHFTGQNWKEAGNYHITINSNLFGYERTAEMIEQIVRNNYIAVPKVKVKELRKKYHLEK